MTSNSRQIQTQAQQQVQTLSPQQILAVKLLELPTVELEERVRSELLDNPALVNESPYEAWFIKVSDVTETEELLGAEAYAAVCEAEEE